WRRDGAPRPAAHVILLTGRSDPDDRRLGAELGVADYLARPFAPTLVARRARELLSGGAVRGGAPGREPGKSGRAPRIAAPSIAGRGLRPAPRDGVRPRRLRIRKTMPSRPLVLARRMERLGTETAFEVLARAKELERQGRAIVHLEI